MPGYGDPPKETRFKPGESGNPFGRPKGSVNMTTLLRELLAGSELEKARNILSALVRKAEDGDVPAIKLIIDRIDGLLAQRVINEVQDAAVIEWLLDRLEEHGADMPAVLSAMRDAFPDKGK